MTTTTGYAAPVSTPYVRWFVVVMASLVGPAAAALPGFLGLLMLLWCPCDGGQQLWGGALLGLALLLALSGPLLAALLLRRASLVGASLLMSTITPLAYAAVHWGR